MITKQKSISSINKKILTNLTVKVSAPAAMPVEARIAKKVLAAATSNDTLYGDLEARYGGAFAQWVIDSLNRTARNRDLPTTT